MSHRIRSVVATPSHPRRQEIGAHLEAMENQARVVDVIEAQMGGDGGLWRHRVLKVREKPTEFQMKHNENAQAGFRIYVCGEGMSRCTFTLSTSLTSLTSI
jgi:hypothetical protein